MFLGSQLNQYIIEVNRGEEREKEKGGREGEWKGNREGMREERGRE